MNTLFSELLRSADSGKRTGVIRPYLVGAGAGTRALEVEEIRNREDFAALAPEWRELLAESGVDCLFLTWEWLHTWWELLSGSRQLRIFLVRRGTRLIAIAPFALRAPQPLRLVPFRALEFLGVGAVGSDYLDLIIKRGEESHATAALASHMSDCRYMLDMRRVLVGSANVDLLVDELVSRNWRANLEDDDICPFVRLSGSSWDDYLSGLGRVFRSSLRRARRKAESSHEVSFSMVRTDHERGAAMEEFFRLHHKRWNERSGSLALHDQAVVRFHEKWSRIALARGWLRLSILRFDKTPVAGMYEFSYAGKRYFYLSGFDPAYSAYGAGRICMEESLRSAFDENQTEYDFLHGGERYKHHWTREHRALGRYRVYPPSVRGYMSRRFMDLRGGGKKLMRSARQADAAVGSPETSATASEQEAGQ